MTPFFTEWGMGGTAVGFSIDSSNLVSGFGTAKDQVERVTVILGAKFVTPKGKMT